MTEEILHEIGTNDRRDLPEIGTNAENVRQPASERGALTLIGRMLNLGLLVLDDPNTDPLFRELVPEIRELLLRPTETLPQTSPPDDEGKVTIIYGQTSIRVERDDKAWAKVWRDIKRIVNSGKPLDHGTELATSPSQLQTESESTSPSETDEFIDIPRDLLEALPIVPTTNTGWPHEKKLHERIAELEAELDETGRNRDEWKFDAEVLAKSRDTLKQRIAELNDDVAKWMVKFKDASDEVERLKAAIERGK